MKALDGIRKSMRTWTIQKCEENGEYWEDVEGPDTGMHNGRIAKVKVTDVPADKLLRALEVVDLALVEACCCDISMSPGLVCFYCDKRAEIEKILEGRDE